jgi:hypothetical protein
MLRRMFAPIAVMTLTATLATGCVGPTAGGSDYASAAIPPPTDLAGTWYGTLGQFAATQYEDESISVLRINEDGTFTATVTPHGGTNNLAKPATLRGRVVTNGNRVTLQNTQGPWPWIVLERSGHDVLYGIANDPAIEAPVMIKFERGDSRQGRQPR